MKIVLVHILRNITYRELFVLFIFDLNYFSGKLKSNGGGCGKSIYE
jgi:hypothetical protein